MPRGVFITLEGPEGAGKTTQAHALAKWLRQAGHRVTLTREPGGDPLAEAIRALVQNPEQDLDPRAELLLFLAARAQHVAFVIRPALEEGNIVVCDRFSDSTVAYQGYGLGLPLETVQAINTFATGGTKPDLTLLLDLDVRVGLARQREHAPGQDRTTTERSGVGPAPRGTDRMERRDVSFHERVRRGFLRLAAEEPTRIRLIDANRPREAVTQEVLAAVAAVLAARGFCHEP